jgi:thioredoxin 1
MRSNLARRLIYKQNNDEKVDMNTKQVKEINEPEFETEVLRCTQPVLVGFLTGWSKPCQLVEPVLDEVAQACNGNEIIFKVNVDDNPDLGTIYGVQSIPMLIFFFNGMIRAKIVGMVSAKAILAKLQSLSQEKHPAGEQNSNKATRKK